MKVELWQGGHFTVCNGADGKNYDGFVELGQALEWVEEHWVEGDGCDVDIIDSDTGEILVHCTDDEDPYDEWDDDVDELFYNPYMGCDDFDL